MIRSSNMFRPMPLAVATLLVAAGAWIFLTREPENTFGQGAFLWNPKAPELTGVHRAYRGSLKAVSLKMNFRADDPETKISFSVSGATMRSKLGRGRYSGQCEYIPGTDEFQLPVGDSGFCRSKFHDLYRYKPGVRETIGVSCRPGTFQFCGMSLYQDVGPYSARVHVALHKSKPEDWLTIASKVRTVFRKSCRSQPVLQGEIDESAHYRRRPTGADGA